MKLPYLVVFHPLAKREFDESVVWYEKALIGLGDEFIKDIEDVIKVLEHQPKLFSIRKKNLREAPTKKFPYLIVCNVNRDEVIITSVFHTSRNPKQKYKKR